MSSVDPGRDTPPFMGEPGAVLAALRRGVCGQLQVAQRGSAGLAPAVPPVIQALDGLLDGAKGRWQAVRVLCLPKGQPVLLDSQHLTEQTQLVPAQHLGPRKPPW